jgi:hypothetical protein
MYRRFEGTFRGSYQPPLMLSCISCPHIISVSPSIIVPTVISPYNKQIKGALLELTNKTRNDCCSFGGRLSLNSSLTGAVAALAAPFFGGIDRQKQSIFCLTFN